MLEELNELLDATPQRPDTVRAGGGKAAAGREGRKGAVGGGQWGGKAGRRRRGARREL